MEYLFKPMKPLLLFLVFTLALFVRFYPKQASGVDLIFKDNFNSGKIDNQLWQIDYGTWSVQNKKLTQTYTEIFWAWDMRPTIVTKTFTVSDKFIIETKFNMVSGYGSSAILFRYQDMLHTLFVIFHGGNFEPPYVGRNIIIGKVDGTESNNWYDFPFEYGKDYQITIEVNGATINVYVDSILRASDSYYGNAFLSGKIGFNTCGTSVTYDDVKVTSIKRIINSQYSDEFQKWVLDTKWSFIVPLSAPTGQSYSLTANRGFLRMTTTGHTDLIGDQDSVPKMLENAPYGDYQILIRVLANPDIDYEHAGILIYQDTNNWVRLLRDSNKAGNPDNIYGTICFGCAGGSGGNYVPFPGGQEVILKLTKSGDIYEGAYSTDGGKIFTLVAIITMPSTFTPRIGMTVASTPADNVFSADFDYFRVYTP